jgi:hypothetical protein
VNTVRKITIRTEDLRKESRRLGLDPNKWNYIKKPNGYYEIRKGCLGVGELIFEDMANLLVNEMNKETP